MEDKANEIRKFYTENMKAKVYYQQLHKNLLTIEDLYVFNLKFLYDVFQSGRFEGTKMFEIGSGPTVHYVASASSQFTSIVQSDFVEDNRELLKRWLRGESDHFDWSQFLDLVARVEDLGCDPMTSRQLLSSRIRKAVKGVMKSDVLSDSIVFLNEKSDPDRSPPYDLVTSIWCIENVAPDFDTYVAILKKINNLLRPGGGIIIAGFENGGTWLVGGQPIQYLKLSLNDVATALTMAGFVKHDFRVQEKSIEFGFDHDSLFCVAAEKLG